MQVSTNGLISFDRSFRSFWPRIFPGYTYVSIVSPFWSDADTRQDGEVFYQIYDDPLSSYVQRATQDVRDLGGPECSNFTATWVLVVTWNEVPDFAVPSAAERNTFQVVVITDGLTTFSLMNYKQDGLEWSGRAASAAVGLTTDDASYFINHFLSTTPQVVDLAGQQLFYAASLPANPCAAKARCLAWYYEDIATHGCSYPYWTVFLPPCPCTLFQAFHDFRFRFYEWRGRLSCFVSSFARPFGVQTECCYRWTANLGGALVRGPVRGGSANRHHSVFYPDLHQKFDVQPYQDCCVHTNLCHLYYERRPSTSWIGYIPPFWGIHVVSAVTSLC